MTLALAVVLPALQACTFQPKGPADAPPPPPPAYEPNFNYNITPTSEKLDVTLGIIAPQFSTGSQMYQQANRADIVVKQMLSSMQASFGEILSAKGFATTGPFSSLDEMTFPDKQGTDLVLYPEFDFQVEVRFDNIRDKTVDAPQSEGFSLPFASNKKDPSQAPRAAVRVCDASLSVFGNMLFVAQEPLSKQRMWIKKLDISMAAQTFNGQEGDICDGKTEHWNREVKDAWAKAHEAIFQNGMKAFDAYVDGQEFQRLKLQSIEARKKTNYGG